MPRSLRLVRVGAWYHITSRGIERRPIFKDDRDRSHFVELIGQLPERFGVRLLAYVLMANHYHLLLDLTHPNLSQAMRWLNVSYSVWFNRRHRRSGYLFQGRFQSMVIDPVSWGYGLSAYVHLNPVRTGRFGLTKTDRQRDRAGAGASPSSELVRQRLSYLRGYRWSSYRAYVGLASAPKWLERLQVLRMGAGAQAHGIRNYQRYVEDQLRQGRMDSPWEELQDRVLLGSAEFIQGLKNQARGDTKRKEMPGWKRARIPLEKIIRTVEQVKGQRWAEFKDRHGDGGLALVLALAQRASGLTLSEIARELQLQPSMNPSMVIKRRVPCRHRSAR